MNEYDVGIEHFEFEYSFDYVVDRVRELIEKKKIELQIGLADDTFVFQPVFRYAQGLMLDHYIKHCQITFSPRDNGFDPKYPYRSGEVTRETLDIIPSGPRSHYAISVYITVPLYQAIFSYGPTDPSFWTDEKINEAALHYADQLSADPHQYLIAAAYKDDHSLIKKVWQTSTLFKKMKRHINLQIIDSGYTPTLDETHVHLTPSMSINTTLNYS